MLVIDVVSVCVCDCVYSVLIRVRSYSELPDRYVSLQ